MMGAETTITVVSFSIYISLGNRSVSIISRFHPFYFGKSKNDSAAPGQAQGSSTGK